MADARYLHTASLLASGFVLIAGGSAGISSLATAELYDPLTNVCFPTAGMANVRNTHVAAALGDSRVLVSGGYDYVTSLDTAETYECGLPADTDCDRVSDSAEPPCQSDPDDVTIRPERIDGIFDNVDDDGDTQVDEALPAGASDFDCDGDGFTGAAEDHVYSYVLQTDGDQKTCQEYDLAHPNTTQKPSKRWPADLSGHVPGSFSHNKINVSDLASFVAPWRYIGTNVGDLPGNVRWDLVPYSIFSTDINVQDLAAISNTLYPPMLNGARAFGGPVCPWPE